MTGSATKQSSFVSAARKLDCFASLAMTVWSDHALAGSTVTSGHNAFQRAAFR